MATVHERATPAGSDQLRRRAGADVKLDEYRTPGELDRDRIMYSSEFRRLAGVTQITSVQERRLLHTRLTHSLKVAQLGRRLAQKLATENPNWAATVGLDADVVEVAGLAHDMGHPPFGHVAETRLHNMMEGFGGFEGNAQSYRIVTKLAVRRDEFAGLDLTRRSLAAILKYPAIGPREAAVVDPWTDRSRGTKWGCYPSEKADFHFVRGTDVSETRSVEAILMDWADDVSFATHDIDDYFRAGLIPLHALESDWTQFAARATQRLSKKHGSTFDTAKFGIALDTLKAVPITAPFSGSRTDRALLHTFVSSKITELLNGVVTMDSAPYVRVNDRVQYEAEALKELTWFYVIERPALATLQEGQKLLVERLFTVLRDWVTRDPYSPRVPVQLRQLWTLGEEDTDAKGAIGKDYTTEYVVNRAVCDYVCTLTESQALDMHERMTGGSAGSLFGTWFA